MIRCVWGYCTNSKKDVAGQPVNALDEDIRKARDFIRKIYKKVVRSRIHRLLRSVFYP